MGRQTADFFKQLLVGEWAAVTRWVILGLCIVALYYGDQRYVTIDTMRTKEAAIVETRKMDLEAINARFRELENRNQEWESRLRSIESKLERISTDIGWIKTSMRNHPAAVDE